MEVRIRSVWRGPRLFTPKIPHFLVQLSFILLLLQHRLSVEKKNKTAQRQHPVLCTWLSSLCLFATSVHKAEQINELKQKTADESSFLSVQSHLFTMNARHARSSLLIARFPHACSLTIEPSGGWEGLEQTHKRLTLLPGVTEDCREARGAAPCESFRHEERGAALGELLHPLWDRQEVRPKLHLVAL